VHFLSLLAATKSGASFPELLPVRADSCQLVQGHRCYDSTPRATHLDAATAFIKAHPGEVSPITVTIGGNDVLALVPAAITNPTSTVARLPAVFRTYRANLDVILSRLRAAAPAARIIVTTQPNSLGGIPASFLPRD
jgi:lysophospholipase L1-like esterase